MRRQRPIELPDQPLNAVVVEHIRSVLDTKVQFIARHRLDRERVVVVVAAGDVGDLQPVRTRQQ